MSENERMERAKRIRRMREGQRDEGDEPGEESSDDQPTADTGSEADAGQTAPDTTPTDSGAAAASAAAETKTSETEAESDTASDAGAGADEEMPGSLGSSDGTRAELPSAEEMEAAMENTMAQAESVADAGESDEKAEGDGDETGAGAPAGPAGVAETSETTQEPETRVLEFALGDEQYCLDIKYIEEIVKHTSITRVPNTPEFVEGVVDLRGQITTILNPKVTIDKPNTEAGDLIVVFDGEAFEDQGHIGWVVDDVRQVSPVSDDEVNDPPMADDHINGVIDREDDDQFVIWTTPDLALEEGG